MTEFNEILAKFQKEGDLPAHETALVLGLALGYQSRIKELEMDIRNLKALSSYPTNKSGDMK